MPALCKLGTKRSETRWALSISEYFCLPSPFSFSSPTPKSHHQSLSSPPFLPTSHICSSSPPPPQSFPGDSCEELGAGQWLQPRGSQDDLRHCGRRQLFLIIPRHSTCFRLFLAAFHRLSLLSESRFSPDLDSLLLFLEHSQAS